MKSNNGQDYYAYLMSSQPKPVTKVEPRERQSWDEYALRLAWQASDSRSQDPYVQVGACALRHDMSVAGVGYNGLPPDIDIDWSDRDERRLQIKKIVYQSVYDKDETTLRLAAKFGIELKQITLTGW
jgi:deoxycytidylate deaminase